jgi:hypothetical protein
LSVKPWKVACTDPLPRACRAESRTGSRLLANAKSLYLRCAALLVISGKGLKCRVLPPRSRRKALRRALISAGVRRRFGDLAQVKLNCRRRTILVRYPAWAHDRRRRWPGRAVLAPRERRFASTTFHAPPDARSHTASVENGRVPDGGVEALGNWPATAVRRDDRGRRAFVRSRTDYDATAPLARSAPII